MFFIAIFYNCPWFQVSNCMEVTCNNFESVYRSIENVVSTASFVALDVEFLGLNCGETSQKCSLFDSPAERYEKQRESVVKFPPVQLGLSFFTPHDDGNSYEAHVYNTFLFKQGLQQQEFSFSVSSMSFLDDHGFDFNTFVAKGVSHLNLDELDDIMSKFKNSYDGIDSFGEKMRTLLSNVQQTLNHKLARLRRKSTGSEGAQSRPFEAFLVNLGREHLNDLQKSAILYKLYTSVPGVRMRIINNMLECDSTRLTKRELVKIKEGLLKTISRELMGVSEVVMAIIDAKLPIVGHNALYDLMYLYHYFVADLPRTYEGFKAAISKTFPIILDTKYFAEECTHKLSWHGVMSYRLEALGSFFESEASDICAPRLAFDLCTDFPRQRTTSGRALSGYHNAAFDAFTTGHIFLRLAHLVGKPIQMMSAGPVLDIDSLIDLCLPLANRVPVPLLGIPYVHLAGADPPSRKPAEISVYALEGGSAEALIQELRCNFGRWRCDVRMDEDGVIRIATNTDTTCRRVYNFCLSHDSYSLLDATPTPSEDSSSPDRSPSPRMDSFLGSNESLDSLDSAVSTTSETSDIVFYKWALCTGSLLLTAHILSKGSPII